MACIAVFGASGRTGQRVVQAAIAQGHTVRALVRDPARLAPEPAVTPVAGDVLDPDAVARALEGADGALSVLGGGTPADPRRTRSLGIRNIVTAMQAHGPRRIVAVGSGGVLDSTTGPGRRSEQPGFPAEFQLVTAEHFAAYEFLRDSTLDWTYVCPHDIPDGDATGRARVAADVMPAKPKALPTGDLADFLLREYSARDFVGHRVGICT